MNQFEQFCIIFRVWTLRNHRGILVYFDNRWQIVVGEKLRNYNWHLSQQEVYANLEQTANNISIADTRFILNTLLIGDPLRQSLQLRCEESLPAIKELLLQRIKQARDALEHTYYQLHQLFPKKRILEILDQFAEFEHASSVHYSDHVRHQQIINKTFADKDNKEITPSMLIETYQELKEDEVKTHVHHREHHKLATILRDKLDKLASSKELKQGDSLFIVQPGNNDLRNNVQLYQQVKIIHQWSLDNEFPLAIEVCMIGYGGRPTTATNFSFIRCMNPVQVYDKLCDRIKLRSADVAHILDHIQRVIAAKYPELKKLHDSLRVQHQNTPQKFLFALLQDDRTRVVLSSLGPKIKVGEYAPDDIYLLHGQLSEAQLMAQQLQDQITKHLDIKVIITDCASEQPVQSTQVRLISRRFSTNTGENVAELAALLPDDKRSIIFITSPPAQSARQSATFERQLPDTKWLRIIAMPLKISADFYRVYDDFQLLLEMLMHAGELARKLHYPHIGYVAHRELDRREVQLLTQVYAECFSQSIEQANNVALAKMVVDFAALFNAMEDAIPFVNKAHCEKINLGYCRQRSRFKLQLSTKRDEPDAEVPVVAKAKLA